MSKVAQPELVPSIFAEAWVDIMNSDNTSSGYFCSGVVRDVTGETFYVLHPDPDSVYDIKKKQDQVSRPYFIHVSMVDNIRFAPQKPPPPYKTLFAADMPFWIGEKADKPQHLTVAGEARPNKRGKQRLN